MTKRALRRHHLYRMKAKARRIYRIQNNWMSSEIPKEFEEAAEKRADYLKTCSCSMCGNPRKYFKDLTIQEIKANLYNKE
jgi:hypothetical protein